MGRKHASAARAGRRSNAALGSTFLVTSALDTTTIGSSPSPSTASGLRGGRSVEKLNFYIVSSRTFLCMKGSA